MSTQTEKALAAVTKRAEQLDAAKRNFAEAVIAASESGASLRTIASAASASGSAWTHERIRQVKERGGVK